MKLIFILFIPFLFTGCTSEILSAIQGHKQEPSYIVETMHSEIEELKRALSTQQLDLQLLEEKFSKSEKVRSNSGAFKNDSFASLEKKIHEIEKNQEKIIFDLKELSSHSNQTTTFLKQYGEKINTCMNQVENLQEKLKEVVKLKSTLTSISKAVGNSASTKVYKVRSGDSLEKIARNLNVSIEDLKKTNGLSNDTIFIDQELKIP